MGITLNRVCSGRSLWRAISQLCCHILTELCYPLLNINCIITYGRYLNLAQQHEIRTRAQKVSNTALKPCSPAETASNFKVLANQNKMNTGGMCEKMESSGFHPRSEWKKDSGLVVKLLHVHLSLFALWGEYFIGFSYFLGGHFVGLLERGWVGPLCAGQAVMKNRHPHDLYSVINRLKVSEQSSSPELFAGTWTAVFGIQKLHF